MKRIATSRVTVGLCGVRRDSAADPSVVVLDAVPCSIVADAGMRYA